MLSLQSLFLRRSAECKGVNPLPTKLTEARAVAQGTRLLASVLLVVTAAATSAQVTSDEYPARPIRLVVPYPPGGPVDSVGRAISGPLSKSLGQPIVVENKVGAGGSIGMSEVARARADGYTLALIYETHVTANLFDRNIKFDALESFDYVTLIGDTPTILVTSVQSGLDTLPKFIAAAKSAPGRFNQGVPGPGSSAILKPELLHQALGTKVTYVPFNGGGPVFTALLGGQVDVVLASASAILPFIQSRKVNAIAVGSSAALPQLPDVPTLSNSIPGYQSRIWIGLVGPKGLPVNVAKRIERAVQEVLQTPALRRQLGEIAFEVQPTGAPAFVERARADYKAAEALVTRGVLKADE